MKLKTIVLTAILVFLGAVSANGQNALSGRYIFAVEEGGNSYNFALKFEREDSVYYSYAYRGYGTIGGRWITENGLVKVLLTRGNAEWSFILKPEGVDLVLTNILSKTGTDEVPDFKTVVPVGAIFKKDVSQPTGPDLTAEDFLKRALELIAGVRRLKDISAENIERRMKIKAIFNEENRREYGFGGNVRNAPVWSYGVTAYPFPGKDNKKTDTLRFFFNYELNEPVNPDLSPICKVDFKAFGKKLATAGFSTPAPVRGSHNAIIYWQSARGKISLNISADADAANGSSSERLCVKMITVGILD